MCQHALVTWDRFRPLGTSVSSLWEDLESTALDTYRVTMPHGHKHGPGAAWPGAGVPQWQVTVIPVNFLTQTDWAGRVESEPEKGHTGKPLSEDQKKELSLKSPRMKDPDTPGFGLGCFL